MDTIHIKDLVFSGKHGVHHQEQYLPQRFSISVSINTLTKKASQSDDVRDVIDYVPIRDKIRKIIEGPHMHLIETIAETIATTILFDMRIHSCTVTLNKLDIFDNGIPGITIHRHQTTRHLTHLKLESLLSELEEQDIAVRRLIPTNTLHEMKEAALAFTFIEAEKEYGERKVQQNFTYFRNYPHDNVLWEIGKELEFLLAGAEERLPIPVFRYPLSFNEISSQQYPVGEVGISIHRDESRFKDIIAICMIEGEAEFYTQNTREDTHQKVIPVSEGDVIFMKAPGFGNCGKVPLHGVRKIASPRLSITYRQEHIA